ncbi:MULTISPECIES: hypothetical protein [unclassified Halomonas]|uniref:hypothetical protein n=1 Tax=unclassified Halomonas TaxID=2609666 RepID=UPI003B931D64
MERLTRIYVEMDILTWLAMSSILMLLVGAVLVWVARLAARKISYALWERRIRRVQNGRREPILRRS